MVGGCTRTVHIKGSVRVEIFGNVANYFLRMGNNGERLRGLHVQVVDSARG